MRCFLLVSCIVVSHLIVSAVFCAAQTDSSTAPAKSGSPPKKAIPAKYTVDQERGLRLLSSVEAEAAGLEPDMRAFVLWRASYVYETIDEKKAEKIARESFTASQSIEDASDNDQCGPVGSAGDIKSWIQQHLLSDMIGKNQIAEAEGLFPQSTKPVRNLITRELIQHYIEKKDLALAETFFSQLTDSEDYPFDTAADLVLAMGPEKAADRMAIFNQALNNFEQHGDQETMGQDDFGNFIERTWAHVPSALVLDAANKVLDEAKSTDLHSHFSMVSEKGSVTLNSIYELRLFQLLPVIEELDKEKAESLLRDNAETRARLSRYPQGMQSLTSEGNIDSYAVDDDDSSSQAAPSEATQELNAQLRKRKSEIAQESDKDPARALADTLGLPVQGPSRDSPRAQTLIRVAEGAEKKQPSVAKSALDEISKIEDQLTPEEMAGIASLPQLYFDLGYENDARSALKALLKSAEKIYASDIDADDPNKAFKGTWPSADLWRRCIQIAAKISPTLAEEIIAEIPDREVASAQKIAFASSLLGVNEGPTIVSDCRKNHSGYTSSN